MDIRLCGCTLLFLPALSFAGVCDRTWDGDRLAALSAGRSFGQMLRLNDQKGEPVTTISVGQIKAFHDAKDGIAKAVNRSPAFVICDNPSPNAFAFPGKNGDVIGVTVGMLKIVNGDRDMAAAVIGHEYAHHVQNHMQSAQARNVLLQLLGLAVGIALESKIKTKSGLSGLGLGLDMGNLGAGLISRKFDRDQEREADEVGFGYMLKAGFSPQGSIRMAEQMQRSGSANTGLFFDSHPGWEERLERFKTLTASNPQAAAIASTGNYAAPSSEKIPSENATQVTLLPTYQASDGQKAFIEAVAALQRKDTREGVRHMRAAADAGYATAQASLGYLYSKGLWGLPLDEVEAVRLYKLSVEQGDGLGQANLGFMYSAGRGGLEKNMEEAVRLYRLSSEQGQPQGQANLGYLYLYGQSLPKDEQEALHLFQTAAEKGNALARNNLALMHQSGMGGLEKNDKEAVRLYQLAAAQGNGNAQASLGHNYLNGLGGLEKNESEGLRYLNLSVANGSGFGQAYLGSLYQSGKAGLPKNPEEAVRLYKLAAAQGSALGKNNLGAAYEFGFGGVEKDVNMAISFYKAAAAIGSPQAKKNLARLGVE